MSAFQASLAKGAPRMNAHTIPIPERDTHLLDVSPALETSSAAPLGTYWIPLHELITHWTEGDPLLHPAPVAPVLTAIGHALFALSRETRALRLYTLAWEKQCWHAPDAVTQSRSQQVVRHLQEAAHHWSRAAFSLDSLLPTDLDPAAFARARQLSRIARTQQERLWKLTEEVRADVQAWRAQQEQEAVS
jgi:hypothetical protein